MRIRTENVYNGPAEGWYPIFHSILFNLLDTHSSLFCQYLVKSLGLSCWNGILLIAPLLARPSTSSADACSLGLLEPSIGPSGIWVGTCLGLRTISFVDIHHDRLENIYYSHIFTKQIFKPVLWILVHQEKGRMAIVGGPRVMVGEAWEGSGQILWKFWRKARSQSGQNFIFFFETAGSPIRTEIKISR